MQNKYEVIVYGEDYCPYCNKVKDLFDGLDIQYQYKYRSQHQEEFKQLSTKYNHTTIPLVLANGQFIGGCSDVQAKLKNGQLVQLLGL